MADIFKEIIPSILQGNDHCLDSEEEEKTYNAFVVNRALSQHIDCIFHAQEMNLNGHLDKKLQYDYLFHTIKRYKRKYQKWAKADDNDGLSIIMKYYNCSIGKAKILKSVLSEDQIKVLESRMDVGGKI